MASATIKSWSKYFLELSPSSDVKKRYQEKIDLAGLSEDPYCRLEAKGKGGNVVLSVEWTNWPDITWPDIYNYLILTPGVTHEQLKAYKSLDGYNFFVNGKVSNIVVTEVQGTTKYLFTALVKHSQALSIPALKVWIVVISSGEVICAHCSCMAGVGEVCAHVGALLFTAEANTRAKHQMSCTSLPCAWLPCNYQFVPAIKISSIDFKTPRAKRQATLLSNEEVCESAVQTKKLCKMSPPTPEQMMQFYTYLSKTKGSPVVLSHTPEFSDKYIPVNKITGFPKPLTELFEEDAIKLSYSDLLAKCDEVYNNYVFTSDEAKLVESHTREQSNSRIWFQQRSGRVTASKLKSAISTNPSKPSTSLIKSICYPDKSRFYSTACKYGCDHEDKARKEYALKMHSQHSNFSITESGLIIHTLHPFMGATPDGVVHCECCGTGVIEIKCPFSCSEKCIQLNAVENPNFFLHQNDDGALTLKQNHAYFYQTQMQMKFADAQFCDFIVWREGELFVQRIPPDTFYY